MEDSAILQMEYRRKLETSAQEVVVNIGEYSRPMFGEYQPIAFI